MKNLGAVMRKVFKKNDHLLLVGGAYDVGNKSSTFEVGNISIRAKKSNVYVLSISFRYDDRWYSKEIYYLSEKLREKFLQLGCVKLVNLKNFSR